MTFESDGETGEGGEEVGEKEDAKGEPPIAEQECDGESEEPVARADESFLGEKIEEEVEAGKKAETGEKAEQGESGSAVGSGKEKGEGEARRRDFEGEVDGGENDGEIEKPDGEATPEGVVDEADTEDDGEGEEKDEVREDD